MKERINLFLCKYREIKIDMAIVKINIKFNLAFVLFWLDIFILAILSGYLIGEFYYK
jgi:hypothetical protein